MSRANCITLKKRAQALAAKAERLGGVDFLRAQILHGETKDLYQQLLCEYDRMAMEEEEEEIWGGEERSNLKILIDYHARRAPPITSLGSSDHPPQAMARASSFFPRPVKVVATTGEEAMPCEARTDKTAPELVSVHVAMEEMKRFEDDLVKMENTRAPHFPPIAMEDVTDGEKDADGFYKVSLGDLQPTNAAAVDLTAAKNAQYQQQKQRAAQQIRRRIQDYIKSERDALQRKTDEYWILSDIVHIARQEMQRMANKNGMEIEALTERIRQERATRAIVEAKLAALTRQQ